MRPEPPLSARVSLKSEPGLRPRLRSAEGDPAPAGKASASSPEDTPIESADEIQRWTARRRTALVLSILKSEMAAEEVAHRHGLALSEVEDWKQRFLSAAHNALRSRPRDEDAIKDEQIRRLKQKVGELVLEMDLLREAARNGRPGALDEIDE